jgi:hypothetical protein
MPLSVPATVNTPAALAAMLLTAEVVDRCPTHVIPLFCPEGESSAKERAVDVLPSRGCLGYERIIECFGKRAQGIDRGTLRHKDAGRRREPCLIGRAADVDVSSAVDRHGRHRRAGKRRDSAYLPRKVGGEQQIRAGRIKFQNEAGSAVPHFLRHDRVYQEEVIRVGLSSDPDVPAWIEGDHLRTIVAAAAQAASRERGWTNRRKKDMRGAGYQVVGTDEH